MNVRRYNSTSRSARVVRGLTAAALAALLSFAAAPALADDASTPAGVPAATTQAPAEEPAAVDPAPAPAEEPAAEEPAAEEPATEEPATEEPAPAEEPAPVEPEVTTPAEAEAEAAEAAVADKSVVALITEPLIAALVVDCLPGTATIVGGFEIDGDTCAESVQDWSNTGQHVSDGLADATGFTGGTSENDDPLDWDIGGSPNGKTDIDDFWAYSKAINGTVYGFFGLTNDSTSGGTSQYDLEYNQLDAQDNNGFAVPNRSAGDLLFRFSSTGSDPIQFTDAKIYTNQSSPDWDDTECFETDAVGGWCTIPIPMNAFTQQVNDDGTFFEGAIDIGLFFGQGDCSGEFGVVSVRSVTGNAFATSALKDYVEPLNVNTPSTCGTIIIEKDDQTGTPVCCATFTIAPNPTPGVDPQTPFSITDNDSNDKDPADGVIKISPATPGVEYTVTETNPPADHELPADPEQGPTLLGESATITFTFVNPRIGDDLTISGIDAEFLTRVFPWTIEKSTTTPKIYVKDGQATAEYNVVVTTGDGEDEGWDMNGTITVHNPNDWQSVSVTGATVSYDGGGGVTCDITDAQLPFPIDVAASGDLALDFDCDFTSEPNLNGTITANVTWDAVAANTPNDSVEDTLPVLEADWTVASVNDTVTVVDDNATPGDTGDDQSWPLNWADVYAEPNHQVEIPYSIDLGIPEIGTCDNPVNTASVIGDGDEVLDSDDATVEVCNPYTQISALKLDHETGEPLAGATFTLSQNGNVIGEAESGADGIAVFDNKLLPGTYVVTETIAPDGYSLPVGDEATVEVVIDHIEDPDSNFVENGVMAPIVFRDPAQGQIAIIAKEHWERDPGTDEWVVSDGEVNFGDEIRYTIEVGASGPKLFHDVTVTDFVPGYNPEDVVSDDKGVLVAGSSDCSGDFTCSIVEDPNTGLITWTLTGEGQETGTVQGDATGIVEFTITFPEVPDNPEFVQHPDFDRPVYQRILWNQGYLNWTELTVLPDPVEPPVLQRLASIVVEESHELASNEVTDVARIFEPVAPAPDPEPPLPPTGGPNSWIMLLGFALVLLGGGVVLGERRVRVRVRS